MEDGRDVYAASADGATHWPRIRRIADVERLGRDRIRRLHEPGACRRVVVNHDGRTLLQLFNALLQRSNLFEGFGEVHLRQKMRIPAAMASPPRIKCEYSKRRFVIARQPVRSRNKARRIEDRLMVGLG